MKVEFLHTGLSLRARSVITLFFYALAALLQVMFVKGDSFSLLIFRFAAIGLFVIPLWFLKARNYTNKPPAGSGSKQKGTWRPVTVTDLDRFRDRIRTIRKAEIPVFYNWSIGIVVTFLFIFLLVPVGVIVGAVGFFVILDLYLVFIPFLFFARIEKWLPAISGKITAFDPILDSKLPEKIRLEPMLFFGGGGGNKTPGKRTHRELVSGEQVPGEQIPVDIRLMLAPGTSASQEVRDELLGAQFQVTYNNGPNGPVPYVYAVFITKGKGKIWQSLKNVGAAHYITEPGSSTEGDTVYGTVVLRLDTKSRSDGYHTHESDVRELLGLVVHALEKL